MTVVTEPKLHWTQRVALVRHNLHAARRTGDFTFFKTLQARVLLEEIDHVAVLNSIIGDEADSILSTLDNLNAGIAYVHQDAFKTVHDSIKNGATSEDQASRKAKIRVDVSQQKQIADYSIDKMANSAIALIETQPPHCQDAVANVWITGTTVIADAVKVCLDQLDRIEDLMNDFILLEYSWSTVQTSVDSAISAIRGIFSLIAPTESRHNSKRLSTSSSTSSILRRLSTALTPSYSPGSNIQSPMSPTSKDDRRMSVPHLRASISNANPTHISPKVSRNSGTASGLTNTMLSPIPPTPACIDDHSNIFDIAFTDTSRPARFRTEEGKAQHSGFDDVEIESLDPLDMGDIKSDYANVSSVVRRISSAMAPATVSASG